METLWNGYSACAEKTLWGLLFITCFFKRWKRNPKVTFSCNSDFFANFVQYLIVFCLFILNIDLFGSGNYMLMLHFHGFLACRLLILSSCLFNIFYHSLVMHSSNSIKICLDLSSRTLKSCCIMSLWFFCW